jgi:hypothetical protein
LSIITPYKSIKKEITGNVDVIDFCIPALMDALYEVYGISITEEEAKKIIQRR